MPSIFSRARQFVLLAAVAGMVSWTCPTPGLATGAQETAGGPSLVFVTKSDACDCVRNLCLAGEQEVINFLAGEPYGFRLERIDLTTHPEEGKTYRAVTLPVVVLKSADGQWVARFDSFFTENDLYAAWEKHLGEGTKP
jgi:hypothetical protein